MTDGAISERSRRRRASIVAAAQELAARCGYAGFTIDDLADAVGCSRRTLFNHVSSKEEAVLGMIPTIDAVHVETLRAGGPTGSLIEDVITPFVDALGDDFTAQDWRRLQEVVRRNPELMARAQEHVEELGEELLAHLSARPGVDPRQAEIALFVGGAIVKTAMHALVERPSDTSLSEQVQRNLELARELLAQPD